MTSPSSPSAAGSLADGGSTKFDNATAISSAVIGSSTYALISSSNEGFQIIDISDPSSPSAAGSLADSGSTKFDNATAISSAVIGSSTYALVSSSNEGFQIIDISDPSSPSAVGSLADSGSTKFDNATAISSAVIGSSTYALISSSNEGFQIIDISDPSSPSAAGSLADSGSTKFDNATAISSAVIDSSTYALISSSNEGFQIIDISDPSSPSAAGSLADSGSTKFDNATAISSAVIGSSAYALISSSNEGFQIVMVGENAPQIGSGAYDQSTGQLIVTATSLASNPGPNNDIDVLKLTLSGEGGSSYTLTSSDVEIDSSTQFTVTLSADDQLQLAGLLNKNGTSSGGGSTYNIAASSGWNPGASSSPADATGNAITVANVSSPTLTSATYDDAAGILAVTGSNLPAYPGSNNDIDVSKLTITGGSNGTYTLTSGDVELISSTSFSITLNSSDQTQLDSLLNKNGTSSSAGTTYNIAAADNWVPGADASVDIADASGNAITVSNLVNVAPSGTNKTITINEDSSHTYAASDFGFSDSNGDALSAVIISTLPAAGGLTLDA